MILQFKLKDGRDCYFDVENLSVTGEDVVYDDILLYIDGELYDQSAETWAGHKLSDGEIFESVLNAYLRNDTANYQSFDSGWNVVDALFEYMEFDESSKTITVLPVVEFDEVVLYDLNMETTDFKFYTHDDSFKVFDKNWGLVTDYENFYMEALYDEYERVLNGETECLYIDPDVEAYLQEEFVEE